MLPSAVQTKRPARLAGIALAAAAVLAAADLLPERMAQVSRSVEEVRGRRFSRAVPASRIDKAEARRVLRAKISEGLPVDGRRVPPLAHRARPDRGFAPAARFARRLLRLSGRGVLRPGFPPLLRRRGRRGTGRRRVRGPGAGPDLLARAHARAPGRVAAPGRSGPAAAGGRGPEPRPAVPAGGGGDARHDPGGLEGHPGRRRRRGGADGPPAHGGGARAGQRPEGRAGLLRRPALLPLCGRDRPSSAKPSRAADGPRSTASGGTRRNRPRRSSTVRLTPHRPAACSRRTSRHSPRATGSPTPTPSASGRSGSCSAARCRPRKRPPPRPGGAATGSASSPRAVRPATCGACVSRTPCRPRASRPACAGRGRHGPCPRPKPSGARARKCSLPRGFRKSPTFPGFRAQ